MKLSTKLGLVANVVAISTMAYVFYEKVSQEKFELQQAEMIALEVAENIHRAKEAECLATNIYHEARNEGLTGQRAVAWATLNRVHSDKYPDTICDVVYQAVLNDNGIPVRNQCQFSWFCDGKSDLIDDAASWNRSVEIAEEVMNAYGKETDPTNGAFMYHSYHVDPYWSSSYEKTARIDSHIFYN